MNSITGTQAGIAATSGAPDHLRVTTSADGGSTVAGNAFDVTVTVQDRFKNTVAGYTGSVAFSSGDPYGATLPATYTLNASDNGTHTFVAGTILYTAGTWDVTGTDTDSGITGSANVPVTPAPADHFQHGAFRQVNMSWIYRQVATRKSEAEWWTSHHDDYDMFMQAGSAGELDRRRGMEQLGFWRKLIEHPAYDAFWRDQAVDKLLAAQPLNRGRYRESLETAKPIAPDTPFQYRFRLPTANHVFLPGHRIMVQVQSSWFPLYDRNPQTFVPNIFWARPGDYRKATQRIYHAPDHGSFVELPLAGSR